MVNCGCPIRKAQGLALRIRNRNKRHIREFCKQRCVFRQIHATVQGRNFWHFNFSKQGKMQIIKMKVDNIKLVNQTRDML